MLVKPNGSPTRRYAIFGYRQMADPITVQMADATTVWSVVSAAFGGSRWPRSKIAVGPARGTASGGVTRNLENPGKSTGASVIRVLLAAVCAPEARRCS